MMDDDLDQKDRKESIQHYAHKKREKVGMGGLILAIIMTIIVVAAMIILLNK
jgi:predicted tellurium resistance membrane protein TerC